MHAQTAGFTLAEMAIVLIIVGLLLTSVLSTVSTQLDLRNNRETQTRLDQIKEALIGYAQANGRLPCPADGTLATGASGAGLEEVTSTTTYVCKSGNKYAVLPWATLGVTETDVWGRRFTYKVTQPTFSDAIAQISWNTTGQSPSCSAPVPTPTQSSFALCSLGSFTITTRTAASKTGTSVSGVPVVIISHGKNGYGAYTSGGTQYNITAASGYVDEPANATATATTFYSREQSPQTSSCSDTAAGTPFCEFDDLVAYIPANLLAARMVSAGKLP